MKVIQAHTTQIRFRAEEGAMFKPKINVVGNRVVYDFLRTYNMVPRHIYKPSKLLLSR